MARRINLEKINVARTNTIRDINRQIILNYVRDDGPVSRADIAKVTDLQRSTVSLIVDELLNFDLIKEVEGESSGGRPPLLLSLKTSKAVVIGVDLAKETTIVGTSDLSGRILEMKEFSTSSDFNDTIANIVNVCQEFISKGGGFI